MRPHDMFKMNCATYEGFRAASRAVGAYSAAYELSAISAKLCEIPSRDSCAPQRMKSNGIIRHSSSFAVPDAPWAYQATPVTPQKPNNPLAHNYSFALTISGFMVCASYRRVSTRHRTPVITIATPDQKNQTSTPTASLTGPATNNPIGVASVMAVISKEKTLPITSGAMVSCVYAISGTLINVAEPPMKKQHTANIQKPSGGKAPLITQAAPRRPMAIAAILNRFLIPPQTPMAMEETKRPPANMNSTMLLCHAVPIKCVRTSRGKSEPRGR